MLVRHVGAKVLVLTAVVSMAVLGMSGIASAKHHHHPGGSSGGGTGGAPPPNMTVQIDPNPLVETAQSGVSAVIQVETSPSLAGDAVNISSSQLQAACAGILFLTIQGGTAANPTTAVNNISVILDDDGNATVLVTATPCAPGPSVVEADLTVAPFYTALATLNASPPQVTPTGVFGYPTTSGTVTTGEVETGDTATSGNSDVYAIFYVETDPVYAEQLVEISSAQLEGRCYGGWSWNSFGNEISGTGVNTGPRLTTTLDDDGNAVFAFLGASCAAGPSAVIADVLAGTHATYTTTFNINAPAPTI
ncbi:MAG TPA: hypothetical protein VID75_03985 [Acidimicrobiales bacterium]|jgi:hypothetical protein